MEIRNAVPADEPSILAFLRRIHGEDTRLADAGLWQWHFAAAPLRTESLAYWIAYDGGAITGVLGATDVELSTPAGRRRAIWILDLVVDPGLRRRGVARGLIDASRSYCPIVLGINTARQRSTELLASMGFAIPEHWHDTAGSFCPANQWQRPRDTHRYARPQTHLAGSSATSHRCPRRSSQSES